jgi:hypothetical protein
MNIKFKIIEADIAAARRGYRVFAQTSLGNQVADECLHSSTARGLTFSLSIKVAGR